MAMNLAFWLTRPNALRVLGPIMAEWTRRTGEPAFVMVPTAPLAPTKGKDRLLRFADHAGGLGTNWMSVRIESPEAAVGTCQQFGIRVLVALGLEPRPVPGGAQVMAATKAAGIRWAAAPCIHEELLYALEHGGGALVNWDMAATMSAGSRALAAELADKAWGSTSADLIRQMVPTGFPELDSLLGMDRKTSRFRLGLPQSKPIVLFNTAPRPHGLSRWEWIKWIRPGGPYMAIVNAARRFADRHRALLVAKTRAKHPDYPWTMASFDYVIGDGTWYPYTTLDAVMAADHVCGVASALAVEATAAWKPQTWFLGYAPERYEHPAFLPMRQAMYLSGGGLWNCGAFIRLIRCYGEEDWRDELREWADDAPLHVNPLLCAGPEMWIGAWPRVNASRRFLDAVMGLLCV